MVEPFHSNRSAGASPPRRIRRRRAHNARAIFGVLVFVAACAGLTVSVAWCQLPTASNGPLHFRRVYAPADRAKELANEGTWTVRREEFERLIQAVNDGAAGGSTALKSRVESLKMQARFSPSQTALVSGTGVMKVVHQGEAPMTIALGDFRLAISRATWKGDEAEPDAPQQPARIVLGPDGAMLLWVEKSGEVEFEWSLRGVPDKAVTRFDLQLISCPHAELKIETPEALAVRSGEAVISSYTPTAQEMAAALPETRFWKAAVPASGRAQLAIGAATNDVASAVDWRVSRFPTYELNDRGLRYAEQLKVSVLGSPIESAPVRVDPGLRLTSAYLNGDQIAISPPTADGVYRLQFPEPIQGTGLTLRLQGAGGVLQPNQALPRVRLPNAEWTNERVSLGIAAPLRLASLRTQGCRQSGFEEVGRTLTRHRFDVFDSDYSITIQTTRPVESITTSTIVRAHWGRSNMTADWTTEIRTDVGQTFAIESPIPSGWIVDSVTVDPADRLESWSVEDQGGLLKMDFTSAITPDQPVTVTARAYRRSPLSSLTASDFFLGDIRGARRVERIVALRTDSVDELHIEREQKFEVLLPENLNTERGWNLEEDAFVFRDEIDIAPIVFRLRPKQPHFSAELRLRAEMSATACSQNWRIRCEPQGAPLTRVDVQFQHPLPADVSWTLVGDEALAVAAERLQIDSDEETETWRIVLPRSNLEPFELAASFSEPHQGELAIALCRVENADSQQGKVVIAARDGASVAVKQGGMQVSPLPATAVSTDRQALDYIPTEQNFLELRRLDDPEQLDASQIWLHRLETHWSENKVLYKSEAQLEKFGSETIQATLPAGSSLESLVVNGKSISVDVQEGGEKPTSFTIPLPADVRFVLIETSYTHSAEPIGVWGSIRPAAIQFSCPVIRRSDIVWTPPVLQAAENIAEPTGWERFAQRLVGSADVQYAPFRIYGDATWSQLLPALMQQEALFQIQTQGEVDRIIRRGNSGLTWENVINDYQLAMTRRAESSLPVLFVDRAAMRRLHIVPSTEILPSQSAEDLSTDDSWLLQNGLDVVMLPQGALLTSVTISQAISGGNRVAQESPFQWDQLRKFGVDPLPATDWLVDAFPANPWPLPGIESLAPINRSWNCIIRSATPSEGREFRVVRPFSARAVHWIIVLLSVGLMLFVTGRRTQWLIILTMFLAVATLLAPAVAVEFLRSLFWGGLAAVGVSLVMRRRAPVTRSIPISGAAVLTVGSLFVLAAASIGQEPAATVQPENTSVIWPVIFPVDEKGDAVGEYCFPAKPLYDALQRRAEALRTESRDWLFEEAVWSIDLSDDIIDGIESSPEITGLFVVSTNRPDVRVRLPVDRSVLLLTPDGGSVDGVGVEIQTDDAGISLRVADRGVHLIRVGFRARTAAAGDYAEVRFQAPPIPLTTIRVASESGLESIEFPESLGVVTIDRETGELVAANGAAGTVALRWPATARVSRSASIEQSCWIRVLPGSASCVFRVRATVPDDVNLKQIVFEHSENIRPTLQKPESPIEKIQPRGDGRAIVVELAEDREGEMIEFDLPFQFEGSGFGKLFLPTLNAVNIETAESQYGVTVDSTLRLEPFGDVRLLSAAEFAAAWPAEETPDWAARIGEGDEVGVQIFPQDRLLQVRSQTAISLREKQADVQFSATLQATAIPEYQLTFRVVGIREIESIELVQQGEPLEIRWNAAADQSVTIFVKEALSGECELRLLGTAQLPNDAAWRLPEVVIDESELIAHECRLYRDDATKVELVSVVGYGAIAETASAENAKAPRLAYAWRRLEDAVDSRIEIRSSKNNPVCKVNVILAMLRDGDEWFAEADISANVSAGVVDSIQFEASQWWADQLEPIPGAEISISLAADRRFKTVEIRPIEPLTESTRFRVRGVVSAAAGRRVQLPELSVVNCELINLYAVAPKKLNDQRLNWRLSGLMPALLPEPDRGLWPLTEYETFLAEGDSVQAELESIRTLTSLPVVRLVDVRMEVGKQQSQGVATFYLAPAGLKSCTISAPKGIEIQQIRIADRPAVAIPDGDRQFRVALGAEQLPQRIDVLFADVSGDATTFFAPRMNDVQVNETLWTIREAERSTRYADGMDSNRLSTEEQNLLRFRAGCELIAGAVDATSEKSLADASAWYLPWMRQLVSVRAQLNTADDAPDEVRKLETEQVEIANRLGLAAVRVQAEEIANEYTSATALASPGEDQYETCWSFRGEKYAFQPQASQVSLAGVDWRMGLAAIALLLLIALTVRLGTSETFRSIIYRWPYAMAAIVGVGWWLVGWPSFVGVIIVVIAAAGALRSPWTRVRDDARAQMTS